MSENGGLLTLEPEELIFQDVHLNQVGRMFTFLDWERGAKPSKMLHESRMKFCKPDIVPQCFQSVCRPTRKWSQLQITCEPRWRPPCVLAAQIALLYPHRRFF